MLNKPTHEVELVYYGTTGTFGKYLSNVGKRVAQDVDVCCPLPI